MKGSGGTAGGTEQFIIGACMAGAAVYFFFDSVRMHSGGMGVVSGLLGGGRGAGGGLWATGSMGIVFVPLGIGVFSLFVDASRKWAWWLTWVGLAILAIEMLSRIQFLISLKTSHFIMMLVLFLFGCALMFNSYRDRTPKPPAAQDAGS